MHNTKRKSFPSPSFASRWVSYLTTRLGAILKIPQTNYASFEGPEMYSHADFCRTATKNNGALAVRELKASDSNATLVICEATIA